MMTTIKSLEQLATASGFEYWQDYIYNYGLCGNCMYSLCRKMSKKLTLRVLDAIVAMWRASEECGYNPDVLQRMYCRTYESLIDRL